MLTRISKLWLRATVLLSCLFMLSASFYAWGSTDKIPISASGTIIYGAPITNATLRFKSGFESPITLVAAADSKGHWLSGADGTGYDWDNLDHMIGYVVSGSYPDHIYTELSTAQAETGSRSFYGKVVDSYSGEGQTARVEMRIYMTAGAGGYSLGGRGALIMPYMSKFYISYWMFIPSSYDLAVPGWDMLYETWEWSSPAFRTSLYIYRDSAGLYWYAQGRLGDSRLWSGSNREVPIPKNQWFQLGIYLERHPTSGVFRVWVNGAQIFNFQNVQTRSTVDEIYLETPKIYGGFGIYPVERWYDDLEIWDGLIE